MPLLTTKVGFFWNIKLPKKQVVPQNVSNCFTRYFWINTREEPHFFLPEYKPEKNRDNDPLGQLLIAMVAAREANKDDNPMYGIYINGRN